MQTPLYDRESVIILALLLLWIPAQDAFISRGSWQEDYEIGLKYNIPVYATVDDHGVFTDEAEFFSANSFLTRTRT